MAYWKRPKNGEYPEPDRLVITVYYDKPYFDVGVKDILKPSTFWQNKVKMWAYLPRIWKN